MMTWRLTPRLGTSLAPTATDPFASLQRELGRMVEDLVGAAPAFSRAQAAAGVLRLDVKEDDQAFHVSADLPGLNEKEVEVTFEDGVLTIRGDKKVERDETKGTWHIVERSSGSFARQLSLPTPIDSDKITARFEKGVLTLLLPKMPEEQAKAKKIDIQSIG